MRRSEISKVHDPRTRSCYMLCSVAMYSYVLHTLDEQDVASKYARYQKLVCFNCHKTAKKHIFSFLPVFMTVPEYQNTSSSTSHAATPDRCVGNPCFWVIPYLTHRFNENAFTSIILYIMNSHVQCCT